MERSACQELLEHLERANLFIVPLDEERRWYRYHHLFAQVLNERLLRGAMQEEVATLHSHAAVWFEQQGLAVEAVKHTLATQEWDHAVRLVELHGWPMLLQGQSQMVRGWLKLLPENALRTRPYLLDLQAALFFAANDLEAAERTIGAAEAAIVENTPNDSSHPLFAYISMMRANIARARGDIATCVELSRHVLALLPPPELIRRSVSTLGMALIFRVTGDVGPTNVQLVANAIDATRIAGNLPTLFNAVVAMAELRWMQGQLRQAVATYRAASEVSPKLLDLQALNNGASFYCGLGGVLYEWNQLDSSEEHLVHGIEMIRGGLQTHGDAVTNGYIVLARLQQLRGNGVEAMATLRELQMLVRKWNYASYLHARADAAVAYLALQ
jgi:LuxR family maltose regulon positive regulatory protein